MANAFRVRVVLVEVKGLICGLHPHNGPDTRWKSCYSAVPRRAAGFCGGSFSVNADEFLVHPR